MDLSYPSELTVRRRMFTRRDPVNCPIRVAHYIASGLHRGGVETWLLQIAARLDREKFRLFVITAAPSDPHMVERLLGYNVEIIQITSYQRRLSSIIHLRRVLRALSIDILHSNGHFSSGLVMLAGFGVVRTRVSHARADMADTAVKHRIFQRSYRWLMRALVATFSTHMLSVSSKAAANLFPASATVETMESGIDLSLYEQHRSYADIREQLGIESDDFVVGHVGRLSPEKNHIFLIEAFHELLRLEPRSKLVLVGGGNLEQQIRAQISDSQLESSVLMLGPRGDAAELMRGFDVLAFPSISEGLGRVVIEAQAVNLPVVCSDAIATEAIVISELVSRFQLQDARNFAEILLKAKCKRLSLDSDALDLVRMSSHCVDSNVRKLQGFYLRSFKDASDD